MSFGKNAHVPRTSALVSLSVHNYLANKGIFPTVQVHVFKGNMNTSCVTHAVFFEHERTPVKLT